VEWHQIQLCRPRSGTLICSRQWVWYCHQLTADYHVNITRCTHASTMFYLVDDFESCVIDVIRQTLHHVWTTPRVCNLPQHTLASPAMRHCGTCPPHTPRMTTIYFFSSLWHRIKQQSEISINRAADSIPHTKQQQDIDSPDTWWMIMKLCWWRLRCCFGQFS